ncbi:MAG: TorF family putative porin [Gammaproteobacteria bacterium]|nr:TorF family putative porin [Gammaproteobacteria bacterium]
MYCRRTLKNTALLMLLALSIQQRTAMAEVEFGGDVTITTDYMFRGVSQTMSAPAFQGTIDFETDSGWYGNLWASNVDFTPAGMDSDGANTEINVEAGYYFGVSEHVAASIGWIYYAFPGTLPDYDYDYGEWLASLAVDERHHLDLGFSDNVFGSGEPGTYVGVSTGFDATAQIYIDIVSGFYDLERAYGQSYQYAEFAASGQLEHLSWRLAYFITGGGDTELFDRSTVGERLVLTFSIPF